MSSPSRLMIIQRGLDEVKGNGVMMFQALVGRIHMALDLLDTAASTD